MTVTNTFYFIKSSLQILKVKQGKIKFNLFQINSQSKRSNVCCPSVKNNRWWLIYILHTYYLLKVCWPIKTCFYLYEITVEFPVFVQKMFCPQPSLRQIVFCPNSQWERCKACRWLVRLVVTQFFAVKRRYVTVSFISCGLMGSLFSLSGKSIFLFTQLLQESTSFYHAFI